jgi:hypothetical protein
MAANDFGPSRFLLFAAGENAARERRVWPLPALRVLSLGVFAVSTRAREREQQLYFRRRRASAAASPSNCSIACSATIVLPRSADVSAGTLRFGFSIKLNKKRTDFPRRKQYCITVKDFAFGDFSAVNHVSFAAALD